MKALSEKILSISNEAGKYFSFSNSDGKKWIIAKDHSRTGLCIYQPSSIKGKLVKLTLPILKWSNTLLSSLLVTECDCILTPEISDVMEGAFECNELTYSYFLGTPGVHQKTVIQISRNRKILGYCKVTDSNEVYSNFEKEMEILAQLHKNQYDNIPVGLCVKRIMNNKIGVFVQTTSKTEKSITSHVLDQRHLAFIKKLCTDTMHPVNFFKTAIYRDLAYLNNHYSSHTTLTNLVSYTIKEIESRHESFCFNHGDFTPWNTYIDNGKLFVFDWEYAETDYLPMLDVFHFFTQVCHFEKHMPAEKIVEEYLRLKHGEFDTWISWTGYDSDILYLCYLLSMISRTLQRENELTEASRKNIDLWFEIICLIVKRTKAELI